MPGLEAAKLMVSVGADTTQADQGLATLSERLNTFGQQAAMQGAVLSAGLTLPLVGIAQQAVSTAADFQSSMNTLAAVAKTPGQSAQELAAQMADVSAKAKELGNDLTLPGTSASDAAQAMTELVKGGLSVSQSMTAAKGVLQLSAAAGIENAQAAEIGANALNAFGNAAGAAKLQAEDMGKVTDLLANAANASSVEITDVALSLKASASVYAQAGIPIQELTAAIAQMGNAGIKGSDAGTSLKTMLMALQAPTDKARGLMNDLGISIYDSQGKMKPFPDIIQQFHDALADGAPVSAISAETLEKMGKAAQKASSENVGLTAKIKNQTAELAIAEARYNEVVAAQGESSVAARSAALGVQKLRDSLADSNRQLATNNSTISEFDRAQEMSAQKTGQMTQEQRDFLMSTIFGSDAVRAANVIMMQGVDAHNQMISAVTREGGAADLANAKMAGLNGAIEGLKSQLETAALTVGEMFLPFLEGIVRGVADMVGGLGDINPQLVMFAAGFGAVLAAAGPTLAIIGAVAAGLGFLLSPLGLVIAGLALFAGAWAADWGGIRAITTEAIGAIMGAIGPLLPSLEQISAAFAAVAAFIQQNMALIAGVAAAFAAFAIISTVVGWVTGLVSAIGAFVGVASSIIGVVGSVIAIFTETGSVAVALGAAFSAASGPVAALVAVLGGPLTLVIAAVAAAIGLLTVAWINNWGDIQGKTATALAAISGAISTGLAGISAFWDTWGGTITTVAEDVWTIVTTGVSNAMALISGAITAGMQIVSGDWSGAWDTITQTASTIWQGWGTQVGAALDIVVALFGPAWTTITSTVQTALDAITTGATTMWSTVTGAFTTGMAGIQSLWDTGWQAVQSIGTAAWGLLSAENQTKITELVGLITTLWTTLGQLWTVGTQAVATIVTTWWTTQTALWTTQTAAVTTTVTTWWTDLTTLWTTSTAAIAATLTTWWTTLTTEATTQTAALLKIFTDVLAAITKAITDALAPWVQLFTDKLTEIGAAITGTTATLAESAKGVGQGIIDAILGVINAGIGKITDALTGGVKGALNAARGLLGMSSGGGSGDAQSYLKQAAAARGIDPEQVAKVMMSEGGAGWNAEGHFNTGDSYGPLQLHYAGGSNPARGMGDDFTAATGIDLRTDKSMQAQQKAIDYALDRLKQTGDFREWYGADNALGSRFTPVKNVDVSSFPRGQMGPDLSTNQINWGNAQGLSAQEAAAVCGPYAAYLFAQSVGRMPNAQEALQLARQVGWTSAGMRGPGSEVALLGQMGIQAVQQQATMGNISAALGAGGAILSTPQHYFMADQMNAQGQLHVGATGTVMPGGSDWMSLDQINSVGGGMSTLIALAGQMGAAVADAGNVGSAALTSMSQAQGITVQTAGQAVAAEQSMQTGAQGLAQQLSAGTLSTSGLATSLVQLASQAGVATAPLQGLQSGTLSVDQALMQVMSSLAATDPAMAQLQASLQASGATSDQVAQAMVSALATGAAPAVSTAMAQMALTMGNTVPEAAQTGMASFAAMQVGAQGLFQDVANGSLSMDGLSTSLVSMAAQTGLNTTALAGLQAGTLTTDQALNQVVSSLAIADPQFAALATQVQTNQTATNDWMTALGTLAGGIDTTNPIIAGMASGIQALGLDTGTSNLTFHDMAVKLAEIAAQTGLTSAPLAAFQSGVMNDKLAVDQIISAMALTDPQFAALQQQLATTGTDSTDLGNTIMQALVNGAMSEFNSATPGVLTSNKDIQNVLAATGRSSQTLQSTMMGSLVNGAMPAVANAAPAVLTANQNIQTSMADSGRAATDLQSTTRDQFGQIVSAINDAATKIVEAIDTASGKMADNMAQGMKDVLTAITEAGDDGESAAEKVGQAISQGIAKGIKAKAGDIAKSLKDAIKKAVDAAKSKDGADINSPSRVFADEVGQWIPAGVAKGISDNADMVSDAVRAMVSEPEGEVRSAGRYLTGLLQPNFDQGAALVGTIPEGRYAQAAPAERGPVEISVNVTVPNTNATPEAVARAVARKLTDLATEIG